MKLSTRGRYGMRAMLELAIRWNDGPIMLRTIAGNQRLSSKYLEQILTQLKHAGLVRVMRGAKGGFLLAREPADINLSEILLALEGDLSLVECVSNPDYCEYADGCATRTVWVELTDAVNGILCSLSLSDLVRRSEEGCEHDRAEPKKEIGTASSRGAPSKPQRKKTAARRNVRRKR